MPNRPPVRPIRVLPPAVLLVALAACGGDDDSDGVASGWQAVRDTVGDTLVVRTVSGSVWGDTADLVAEVTIGKLDGEDHYVFGRVSAIAVTGDGRILVTDPQAPALRMFSPDGVYLATFGAEGAGPGEYQGPDGGLAVLSDGRVLLRDPANGRINVYATDGEPLDTWPVRGNFNTSNPLYVDREDNAYTQLLVDPEASLEDWVIGLGQIRPDGSPGDTLIPPEPEHEPAYTLAQREGSSSRSHVPFTPRVLDTFSPDGYFVVGLSDRYAFTHYRNGMPLRVERDFVPVPVANAERAYFRARQTRSMRSTDPDWRWNGPPIPATKPPYRRLHADQDGRIWVMVSQPGVEEENPLYDPENENSTPTVWTEPAVFDLFTSAGEYLGPVKGPRGFGGVRPIARGRHLWTVVRDELDVQRVVRFRIEVRSGEEVTTS